MTLKEILEQDATAMYHATDGLFTLVDEDSLDWTPQTGSNWMTMGQLLLHCTDACGKTWNGFVTGDWGMPVDPSEASTEEMMPPAERMPSVSSVGEARDLLAADRELAMKVLAGVPEERLAGERSAPPWGGPEASLFQHLNGMIWHLGQHKGQLFYYLKLQGKDVNTMHLWWGGVPG